MGKPIYLGFSVLELSKFLMYEAYYDKFQPNFGRESIQLHYTDCDSMVLSIETKDIVEDLYNHRDLFDFSNLNITMYCLVKKLKKLLKILKLKLLRVFG